MRMNLLKFFFITSSSSFTGSGFVGIITIYGCGFLLLIEVPAVVDWDYISRLNGALGGLLMFFYYWLDSSSSISRTSSSSELLVLSSSAFLSYAW
jgi:hypothetical protein